MKPLTQKLNGNNPGISFAIQTNAGKRSKGYRYALARLTKSVNRYSCANFVGAGFKKWKVGNDPVGSKVRINAVWANGNVSVELTNGGYSMLGMSDIEVYDTSELTKEEFDFFMSADKNRSLIKDEEIINLE